MYKFIGMFFIGGIATASAHWEQVACVEKNEHSEHVCQAKTEDDGFAEWRVSENEEKCPDINGLEQLLCEGRE